jgi:hypothetical protein
VTKQRDIDKQPDADDSLEHEVPFGSNAVRLSGRQWIIAALITLALFYLVPLIWQRIEPLNVEPDHRVPYRLGEDYWMYDRYCRFLCSQNKTLVLGDSVMWGHYVAKEQTLSHELNELAREDRFANAGIDGIHPAALAGLIKYYGRAISEQKVILHCNLLWMSSSKHDLQTEKEFSFNHPRLVPQFFPRIPCYDQSYSGRIAVVVGRLVPFCGWMNHLRVAKFQNMALHPWTLENPYRNPLSVIASRVPFSDETSSPQVVAKPWTEKRMAKFNPAWVKLNESFQWKSFKRTLEILRRRGNHVFVLVGPFNEHMLTEESLVTYSRMKREVEAWLRNEQIPYAIPPALPSDSYADASHPLSEGYALLAKQLLETESFVNFLSR